ncbi:MAG: hypothetical protein J6P31_01135, partial [Oscillospiraceae bacterium]|nr:hypothetical protein [Oscillospiraceae bacterium]
IFPVICPGYHCFPEKNGCTRPEGAPAPGVPGWGIFTQGILTDFFPDSVRFFGGITSPLSGRISGFRLDFSPASLYNDTITGKERERHDIQQPQLCRPWGSCFYFCARICVDSGLRGIVFPIFPSLSFHDLPVVK